MKTLYTARATATGGRGGRAITDDKNLAVELAAPGGASKKSGPTTNPEQLFACGYAACFGSAVEAAAKKQGVSLSGEAEVKAEVSLNQDESNGYSLAVTLNVNLPGVDKSVAENLVEAAHQICPYSKATRGNIEVTLKVGGSTLRNAA